MITPVRIRPVVSRDVDDVLRINKQTDNKDLPRLRDAKELIRAFRHEGKEPFVIVAESSASKSVAGFAVYVLHKSHIEILNLAVHSAYWRSRVGSALIANLKDRLAMYGCWRMLLDVHEENTTAHLFLRANKLRAVEVLRKKYHDYPGAVAYQFEWRVPGLMIGVDCSAGADHIPSHSG